MAAVPSRPSAKNFRGEETSSEERVGWRFMMEAACRTEPSLTIRRIAEIEVVRMRYGWIARVRQAGLVQKDEAGVVRMIKWREASTGPIIELCHHQATSHAARWASPIRRRKPTSFGCKPSSPV